MTTAPKVIFIDNSRRARIARLLTLAAWVLTFWSLGYFTGSSALQWVGVVVGLIGAIGWTTACLLREARDNEMTPDEARAWLDENYPAETAR